MKLSVIIIAKNEEKLIKECIRSVQFADEVIVIDSNSSDKTVTIAKTLHARVVMHDFKNYAGQRNFGLSEAKGEWVLYIDADERVSDELKKEIATIVNRNPSTVNHDEEIAYKIPRKNFYLGNNEWPQIEYLERLFFKKILKKWEGKVHEHAVFDGEIGSLEHPIIHFTHRDLTSMINKTNTWGEVEAQMLFDSKHPKMVAWRFLRIMLTKFYSSYIQQEGWKLGTVGLIESIYQSYSYFIIYAKLWEKQNQEKISTKA